MATCPSCKVSTRIEPEVMVIEPVLVTKPLGSFSLAGVQLKVPIRERMQLRCTRCQWKAFGYVHGNHFYPDKEQ